VTAGTQPREDEVSALVDEADRRGELSSTAPVVAPPVVPPSDVTPDAAVDSAALDDRVGNDAPVDDGAEHDLVADGGAADESPPYDGDADEGAEHDVAGDADGGTPDGQAVDEAEDDAMAGDEASQNGQAYDGVGSVSESPAYDGAVYGYEDAEYEDARYEDAGYEHSRYGDVEHDGAADEFADRDDAEETAFVAAATNDSIPYSRAAQAVQHAAPTRADLRIDFGAHLEANYRRLVAQLYAITLDPAEAHSVVQDAYSRAWRSWASISRMPDPTGWVRRVAVRSTMRSWRRFRLRSRRPVGPGLDTNVGAVLAALRRLPPSERRCVVLHHMAGAPLPEIAAVEGLSVGTTAARLARAQQVVSAGLVDVLSDVLGPEPHALDGWASPEWDAHRVAATGHDQEDQR
jgi:DNA-directed RNA polymerase specialized sigma24 family protein